MCVLLCNISFLSWCRRALGCRVEWFLRTNLALGKLWKIVLGPQFQNFTLKCCFFNPNKSGIGGKPPTFVQNDFTPWCLKGTVQRDFGPQFFFIIQTAWVTDQRVKIFSFLVSFSLRYSYFSVKKTDSPGYDTGVKKKFNPRTMVQK